VATVTWSAADQNGNWIASIGSADGIVNLAGAPVTDRRWTAEEKTRILRSRVDATNTLVGAMRQVAKPPRVLVNASAIGYYGSRADEVLTEDTGAGNDFLAGVVVKWEASARGAEQLGVRVALIRTGIVLGKGGGALPRLLLPFKLFVGGTMGPPGQWVSWIHLEDEIGLIVMALDSPAAAGPVNATAPNPVTMRDFSRAMGRALHRPTWAPGIPAAMRLALGERAEVVFASLRVMPERALQLGYQFRHAEIEEALQSLLS